MYIPRHYHETDKEEIFNFISAYNFATIVTVKDNFQTATHLPFVVTEAGGELILTSHFARANEQWQEITGNNVLVIFAEPHAYISPRHYESEMNVPTWNYMAVHVYGRGELITEEAATFSVLEDMINTFEKDYKPQWDLLPDDYKTKLVKGIVAFRIKVTDVQAKKKLSQNKKESERQNIINAFEKSTVYNERSIADLMMRNEKL